MRSVIPDGLALSVLSVGLALSIASLLSLLSLSRQTLEEHLESTRIAEITGRAPEEVQMKRREAEFAGKDFEDVVAAAAAANPSNRSTVKDTARTTVEAAVEPTVGVIGKTTKKGMEPETAATLRRVDKGATKSRSTMAFLSTAHALSTILLVEKSWSRLCIVNFQVYTPVRLQAFSRFYFSEPLEIVSLATAPRLLCPHPPGRSVCRRGRIALKDTEFSESVRDSFGPGARAREVERVGAELCACERRVSARFPTQVRI